MIMKQTLRKIVVLLFLLVAILQPSSAQVNRSKLVGAYIYNFGRYTTWPNEAKYNDFQIVLIGEDVEIIDEIHALSKLKTLKGKIISFEHYNNLPLSIDTTLRMIIVLNEKSSLLKEVVQLIDNRNVLLVSEKIDDKRDVMYNLFDTPSGGLSFEINRANIINHNLAVDPEIILLGGTEIDVAALYRESQKAMDSLYFKMEQLSDSLAGLTNEITTTNRIIDEQKKSISEQQSLLDANRVDIAKDKTEIEKHKADLFQQKELIEQQRSLFELQKSQIYEHQIELDEQRAYIQNQLIAIAQGKQVLDSLKIEIANQHNELGLQKNIIAKQRITTGLAIATGVLSFIILLSLIRGYLSKKKKNKILTSQKEEIEKINKKLELTNKSLFETISKLHETQSQLVSSEKMASLGVLTAGIAHEINNPVNFIYTGINSLKKDIDELTNTMNKIIHEVSERGDVELIGTIEQLKAEVDIDEILAIIPQTVADIKVGAERAADIIKGLRNFSRIDRDSMQLFDVHEGIDSSLLLLKNKFKNHIAVSKQYGQLPFVEGYPGKLNQALLNILSNSIDAIENEGTITIRTWAKEERLFIQVEDSGKGIPPAIIDKIFDPFFTTKSVGKGVGLGLSITYGIIQEHNGKIEVKSDQNRGTVFTISLPCISKNN
jgi:signal transduction histidine kinase